MKYHIDIRNFKFIETIQRLNLLRALLLRIPEDTASILSTKTD
jgi:hypothetical protein